MKVNKPASLLNPLQKMFGTYLRMERKRLSLEAGQLAKELRLAATYYRLIESGRATFSQGLTLKLIGSLSSHAVEVGVVPANIHFHRVALFLVGLQCVSAEMSQLMACGETRQVDLLAVEELSRHDIDFELFHKNTVGYYSCHDDDERQFLEDVAVPCIRSFFAAFNQQVPPASILSFSWDGHNLSYFGTSVIKK